MWKNPQSIINNIYMTYYIAGEDDILCDEFHPRDDF